MKQKLALFDFDGTMIKGDSISGFVRLLVQLRLMPIPKLLHLLWNTLLWKTGRLPVEAVKSQALSPLNQLSMSEAGVLCRKFTLERLVPNLYQDALNTMKQHAAAGDLVLIVSASPLCYLQYLEESLPVTHIIGTLTNARHEVTVNVVRGEKSKQIKSWLHDSGIDPDWANSCAYGDSTNDLDMLSMVGNPVLVNPSRRAMHLGKGIPVKMWNNYTGNS